MIRSNFKLYLFTFQGPFGCNEGWTDEDPNCEIETVTENKVQRANTSVAIAISITILFIITILILGLWMKRRQNSRIPNSKPATERGILKVHIF